MRTNRRALTRSLTLSFLVVVILAALVLPSPSADAPGGAQRGGVVAAATTAAETGANFVNGDEFIRATYASQGIRVDDVQQDSYSAGASPVVGDVVVGHGWSGILTGEDTAVGVTSTGGHAQVFRVTTEDIRRVDW